MINREPPLEDIFSLQSLSKFSQPPYPSCLSPESPLSFFNQPSLLLSLVLKTIKRAVAFRVPRAHMSHESQRATFLETISPWNTSKGVTTQASNIHVPPDILQRSQGEDHTVSHRHRLSLRQYPKDCPPLKVRWFYAVDSPKWKPLYSDQKRENSKPLPSPKKFVPFTCKDSQSIEQTFQKTSDIELKHEDTYYNQPTENIQGDLLKVPVNEDYLYDVDIKQRELAPAYWNGPIYEVRRGTWFFQEGSTIRPCEENLATQLEEGYLKVRPWREQGPTTSVEHTEGAKNISSTPPNETRKYRLFGSYMNSIVSYHGHSTALITNDDFMSRVSTTVYQKLGKVPGTRVVRGFTEEKKTNEAPPARNADQKQSQDSPPVSSSDSAGDPVKYQSQSSSSSTSFVEENSGQRIPDIDHPLRQKLGARVSSFASQQDIADLEEQTRIQEEKEMEDSREADNEDREREIDHLVLVTHGIGQRLGLRLESINFIHDVNVLRKTMKSVYAASPDLQSLNSNFTDKDKNCRVQVLPVCWRHLLDFPYQKVGQNRKELDLADTDAFCDDAYPTLADITLDSVPAVRNLISDLAVDVLLYQSTYCEQMSTIVKQECNRILEIFKKRNPNFRGTVSLCGHSLGSAILFDILCSDNPSSINMNGRDDRRAVQEYPLAFECEELFCLGSPIALFQMLKGKTIIGRSPCVRDTIPESLFTHGKEGSATRVLSSTRCSANVDAGASQRDDKSVSSPRCKQLYNIFHPSDPVSYRMEPLISPAMSSLKPQPLPSIKRSIWTTSGQSLSQLGSRVGQSVGSLWNNFTSGVASSLLNRSLGLSSEDSSQPYSHNNSQAQQPQPCGTDAYGDRNPTLIDPDIETLYDGFQKAKYRRDKVSSEPDSDHDASYKKNERHIRKIQIEDKKLRALNSNGRVDYSIQEGAFDISLIASIASHLSYWSDEDVNHFMLSQMLCRKARQRNNP